MIIYEIDIEVDVTVYVEYMIWLKQHVSIMLTFEGFINVKIYTFKKNDLKKHILVHYFISSINSLNNYLNEYSSKIRNEGSHKFINSVNINRKILSEI